MQNKIYQTIFNYNEDYETYAQLKINYRHVVLKFEGANSIHPVYVHINTKCIQNSVYA